MPKGKWAQGIEPRHLQWFIKDRLAICERPGGYGPERREVRCQEEAIWIRESSFSYVVSLVPEEENLSLYDDCGMPWKHWPFPEDLDLEDSLSVIYPELRKSMSDSTKKVLLHAEEVGDRLSGFLGGYLVWSGMVPVVHEAITVTEKILGKPLGTEGKNMIKTASELKNSQINLNNLEDTDSQVSEAAIN